VTSADLLPLLQLFRLGQSTETAVLRVLSDLISKLSTVRGDSAALVLLDLSTAFDTVDQSILLRPVRAPGL